jgi:NAD(P)-dependent dehydrogenase (short-subunit alcohol dehydrogenase family)
MQSQQNHTILVTGGTAGLGYEASVALAKHFPNSQVIIASRSNADDAAATINKQLKQSNTVYLPLDLSSPDSITAFASNIAKSYPPISHLLLNAGLQFPGPLSTSTYFNSQIEKTFAINHLGHAHLFYLLLPHLTKDVHIVITSSGTHDPANKTMMPTPIFDSAEDTAHPNPKTANKDGGERYSTSKLCNVLWTYALDRHAQTAGRAWKINAFDPGLMPGTGLAREYPVFLRFVWNHVMTRLTPLMRLFVSPNIHTPKQSGMSLARLAIGEDGETKNASGKYFEGKKIIPSSTASYEIPKQDDLWEWTLNFLARGDESTKSKWASLRG